MKDPKKFLLISIQVVTFLFGAFGGFIKRIAPPNQVGAGYPVGVLSFLALIVLMIISAAKKDSQTRRSRRAWLIAGILLFLAAVSASFLYPRLIDMYTYPHDSPLHARKVNASDAYLTADALQYKSSHSGATPEELDQNFKDGDVWTQPGIDRAELLLLICYSSLVLSLSGAIFCLIEANKRNDWSAKPRISSDAHA